MFTKLVATLLLSFFAFSAYADFTCIQNVSRYNGSVSYVLKIKYLNQITSQVRYGKHYDAVFNTQVELTVRNGNAVIAKSSFSAVTTEVDVVVNTWAVKTHGFKFWSYMDELNESGIELTDAQGKKTRIPMVCSVH